MTENQRSQTLRHPANPSHRVCDLVTIVEEDANHLTRGLAARPRHRSRSESAPSAPHRPRASRDMNLVRWRLAPQPRSLVGAMCAHTRSHQSRTPRRGWPATGAGSWDGPCTPPDDSLFNEPWLRREPQPRFPRGRRAGRQQLGRPGQRSSATPTRSANENERSLRFQTLCRTLADVAKRPSSVSSRKDSRSAHA